MQFYALSRAFAASILRAVARCAYDTHLPCTTTCYSAFTISRDKISFLETSSSLVINSICISGVVEIFEPVLLVIRCSSTSKISWQHGRTMHSGLMMSSIDRCDGELLLGSRMPLNGNNGY